jgi:hypothetical protein
MRRSKSTGGLTDSLPKPGKTRGRRTALSDAELRNRRDQFVQIFEGEWGEIGWELQRCKKADDLIRIFIPLAESRSWIADVVAVFCRPSPEPASGANLRKVRSERRNLAGPSQIADESKRIAEEKLHQVNSALTQAKGGSRRIVRRARKQRRRELWKRAQQCRDLTELERQLEVRLKGLEASFVRQEFFRFLKSKRYELTPLNLANATAGLPYMGWRQSMRRSSRTQSVIANGLNYQIFKAIRYLATAANKKTQDTLVRSFHENIPLLPSRYSLPRAELAESWLYLERALHQSYRIKPHLKALPFEITKRYFKQIQSQSQVDIVLAQQAKIVLSKPKVSVARS